MTKSCTDQSKKEEEMNEAFKQEIADMCLEEQTAQELEDCYYSDDEDLVMNKDIKVKINLNEMPMYF